MLKIEEYKLEIESYLKKSSHSLTSLYIEITGKPELKGNTKSFFEAVIQLLKMNKIVVTGYDFDNHILNASRHQTLMGKWIVVEWVKTEQTQILALLNHMDKSDPNNVKKDKEKVFASFTNKFRQFRKQELVLYNKICSKVVSVSLKEWIKLVEDEMDKLMLNPSYYDPDNINYMMSVEEDMRNYRARLNNKPNAEIWYLKGLSQDELDEIKKFNDKPYRWVWDDKEVYFPLYYPNSTTVTKYLDQLNAFKPEKSKEEVRRIFNRILFFVNTHENYNFMKQNFALALSDEEESTEFFELFINNTNPALEKLKSEFRK